MKKIVVIAGGGTGGHIYPALAIAEALKIKDSEVEIHFVGTGQGLEAKIIPSYGYPLHFVPVGMLNSNVNLVTRIKTLLLLPFAFLKALWLVFKLKPNLVLGVGGYASAPMVFLSSLLRKKTYLWEPNAYPGLANRYLSKWVDASLVVFESAKEYLQSKNFYKVGLPVRKEIESLAKKDVALSKDDAFKILIFGGSQGALRINEVVCEMVQKFDEQLAGITLVHQIGSHSYARFKKEYESFKPKHIQFSFLEFIHDMPEKYLWADLVVCRGGASTIAEISAASKPAIIIPFPYAADDHQKKNAEQLSNRHAAVLIEQKDLTAESLLKKILDLKAHRNQLSQMSESVKSFYTPRAAEEIVEILLSNAKLFR